MASRDEFCNVITDIWKNHGVYVWSGNGEYLENLRIRDIVNMEDSTANVARVLRTVALYYERGYNMKKSRCCDCSGLVIAALRDIKAISSSDDFRAKDLQKMSEKVLIKDLQPGDLVFNKTADASHVGVYVGYDMVIEAQGRDYGITKSLLKDRSVFIIGGRLPYFK